MTEHRAIAEAGAIQDRERPVGTRARSHLIADINPLQEHDFHIDAGGHLDHRLILLGALDQIFRDHVAGLGRAFAKAAFKEFAGGKFVALAVGDGRTLKNRIGVGGEASPKATEEACDKGLGDEAALDEPLRGALQAFTDSLFIGCDRSR